MTNVVNLSEYKPHIQGAARCLDCKHEWQGVAPEATEWLECPSCSLVRGRFIHPHYRNDSHWQCGCGNDLFQVTVEGTYCPNCGAWQDFGKD